MLTRDEIAARDPKRLHPWADWHEDFGAALWWRITEDGYTQEPPWCGTPLDDDWPYQDYEDGEGTTESYDLGGDRLFWSFLPEVERAPEVEVVR